KRRDPRATERARQDPFRAPDAEPAHRGDSSDNVLVRHRAQHLEIKRAADDGLRNIDDVLGFARGELQLADLADIGRRNSFSIQAVNLERADRMTIAEALGEAAAHGGRPTQIDLLRADAANERKEQIRMKDG